jgi:hypothetical protein
MVLTKINGVLTWACPFENCTAIKPYGAVGPYTLHAIGRAGKELNIDNWKDIYQYVVRGLPPGEEAWIARMHGRWSTLRCSNGIQGTWTGEYTDPEKTLSILSAELGTKS